MNPTIAARSAEDNFPSSIQEQFATAVGKALTQIESAGKAGEPWTVQTVLDPDLGSRLPTPGSAFSSLRLEGDLTGEMTLCLAHEGAVQLLRRGAEEGTAAFEDKWTELLEASQEALAATLEPVFGRVTLHSVPATSADGKTPLAELQVTTAAKGRAAQIGIFLDADLATSLERLATATRALSNSADAHRPGEDRERLHRVIDVPLAVTLRFGQRQMTLRELLALSTGSLVELDRQVEEPVDLMLGERVVARGEVVIVDGNYGMRILEVIEGAGTRPAPQNA